MKDTCVICNKETAYEESTHIDNRVGYIEGVGQLCHSCYINEDGAPYVRVPRKVIYNTPNDMQLGEKVRRLYYEI